MFGFYEMFAAFSIFDGFFVKNLYLHWVLWWISTVIIAYFATNRRWDQIILSLLVVINFEDVVFWTLQGIKNQKWPFPAGNWWDTFLHHLEFSEIGGRQHQFWPFVPRYYYVVFGIMLPYYLFTSFKGPKYGQILAWIYFPVLIPVLIGTITSEFGFIVILVVFMLLGYGWGIYLLVANHKRKKKKIS